MIFEEGGIIEIIPSCFKMIFKEGGIIEIISTFVYFIKPKRCDRIPNFCQPINLLLTLLTKNIAQKIFYFQIKMAESNRQLDEKKVM